MGMGDTQATLGAATDASIYQGLLCGRSESKHWHETCPWQCCHYPLPEKEETRDPKTDHSCPLVGLGPLDWGSAPQNLAGTRPTAPCSAREVSSCWLFLTASSLLPHPAQPPSGNSWPSPPNSPERSKVHSLSGHRQHPLATPSGHPQTPASGSSGDQRGPAIGRGVFPNHYLTLPFN